MFEHKHQPLLSYTKFLHRVLNCVLLAAAMLGLTIALGTVALRVLEGLPWIEAFLNAVLIMTGLGLTVTLQSTAAKVFTAFYALASSIVFFAVLGILFAPLIHRAFHHFHVGLDAK